MCDVYRSQPSKHADPLSRSEGSRSNRSRGKHDHDGPGRREAGRSLLVPQLSGDYLVEVLTPRDDDNSPSFNPRSKFSSSTSKVATQRTPDGSFSLEHGRRRHAAHNKGSREPLLVPQGKQPPPPQEQCGSLGVLEWFTRAKVQSAVIAAATVHSSLDGPGSGSNLSRSHKKPTRAFGRSAAAAMSSRAHHQPHAAGEATYQCAWDDSVTSQPDESVSDTSSIQRFNSGTSMSHIAPLIANAVQHIIHGSDRSTPCTILSPPSSLRGLSTPRGHFGASTSSFDSPMNYRGSPIIPRTATPPSSEGESIEALIREVAHTVYYRDVGPLVVVAALIYLARISATCCCPKYRVSPTNWFRLVTVCLMVATKMYIDEEHGKVNAKFSRASAVSMKELLRLEIEILFLLDFHLVVEEDEIARWCDWMHALARKRDLKTPLQTFFFDDEPNFGDSLSRTPTPFVSLRPPPTTCSCCNGESSSQRLFSAIFTDDAFEEEEEEVILPPAPPALDSSPLKSFFSSHSTMSQPSHAAGPRSSVQPRLLSSLPQQQSTSQHDAPSRHFMDDEDDDTAESYFFRQRCPPRPPSPQNDDSNYLRSSHCLSPPSLSPREGGAARFLRRE